MSPSDSLTPRATSEIADVASVGDRAGEPVQLRDHEYVAGPYRRECLAEAWPVAVSASESLAEVDPLVRDAEGGEGCALGGEVLINNPRVP